MGDAKAKEGPKFKKINWKLFEQLCGRGCTRIEIAASMNVSEDTLSRAVEREKKMSYAAFLDLNRAKGKKNLRYKQYQIAMKGNVQMLIHLGKHVLDQTEKTESLVKTVSLEQLVTGETEAKIETEK